MARKKKLLKDLKNEHNTLTTTEINSTPLPSNDMCLHDTSLSHDERVTVKELRLQQQPQSSASQLTDQQTTPQYQSDSELMELKEKFCNLEKNKSNLFLIKSYSFNDKTNVKRSQNVNLKNNLEKYENSRTLVLDRKGGKSNNKNKLKGKNEKTQQDLTEYQGILRKPLNILDVKIPVIQSKRPQSLPVTQSIRRSIIKSKTCEDIETPRLKRDSFIRHSLQSIRRSFSSAKKQQNNNVNFACNSSASSSSNSSNASEAIKKLKDKDGEKERLSDLKQIREPKYFTFKEEPKADGNSRSSLLNTTCINLQANQADVEDQKQHEYNPTAIESSSSKVPPSPPSPPPPTAILCHMDSLTVLNEEDEKDLSPCAITVSSSDNDNNNNNKSPYVITEQRP